MSLMVKTLKVASYITGRIWCGTKPPKLPQDKRVMHALYCNLSCKLSKLELSKLNHSPVWIAYPPSHNYIHVAKLWMLTGICMLLCKKYTVVSWTGFSVSESVVRDQ